MSAKINDENQNTGLLLLTGLIRLETLLQSRSSPKLRIVRTLVSFAFPF